MRQYTVKRLLVAVPTLFLMTLIVFAILHVLPGDVATMILGGGQEGGGLTVAQTTVDKLRSELGVDRPLYIQYVTWVGDVLRGDLGDSLLSGQPVGGIILRRLALTVELALMAKVLSLALGIAVGIVAAVRQDRWIDHLLRVWSVLFLAIPGFWLGLLVLLVGLNVFGWMPPVGSTLLWEQPGRNLTQMVWPALILGLSGAASYARLTRSSMLEVLRDDYIRTARSKGLMETVIIRRHALKNALIPVVTAAGISFGHLISGVVVMERVFTIPGIGLLLLNSIELRDYTVVQGLVLLFGMSFIVINIVVDLVYARLDPRIRFS